MARPPSDSGARESSIRFDEHGILRLVAERYPKLEDATAEGVQNAIDPIPEIEDRPAKDRLGKKYKPRVDVLINVQRREIIIRDNGDGVSLERYEECLQHIGKSDKDGKPNKLGEFGLGFMSPFAKCRVFYFMTSPRSNENGPFKWTFDTNGLRKQRGALKVPARPYVQKDHEWWNSELHIVDFTTDKMRSKIELESFCTLLLDSYNEHMKRKGLIVNVTITDENGFKTTRTVRWIDFTGVRLPVKTYTDPVCGTTSVQLYLAKPSKSGKPKGKVTLRAASGFGMPLGAKALSNLMSAELLKDLKSGIFEGDIRFDKPVKMEPSRRWFNETDALYGAVDHIETWMKKEGATHIQKQRDEDTKDRYKRTAHNAQKVTKRLLKDRPKLAALVSAFTHGSVGKEHAKVPGTKGGVINAKSIDGTEPKTKNDQPKPRSRNPKPKEKPNHIPLSVGGAKGGQPRKQVKKNSLGLILDHGRLQTKHLWDLDEERGVITVNVYHPTWEDLDRTKNSDGSQARTIKQRDKAIGDLQMKIVGQALIKLLMKKQLAEFYGDDNQTSWVMSVQDNIEWIEDAMTEILNIEAFFISEADRITQQGGHVDRVGKNRRAKSKQKKGA